LASFKAHFSGEPIPPAEEINLTVPTPSSSGTGKKKNKKSQGSSGPSSFNDTGEILESRVNTSNGSGHGKKDLESEGMILDRVVEGGLEGVEGMSPSRTSHPKPIASC
jgi:hypothetical protein